MLYLFDIDGTILLTGGAGTRAINGLFSDRYGVSDAMSGVRAGGRTDPLIMTEIFEGKLGRAPIDDELDALLEEYVPRLRRELERADGFRIMPAVHEALDFLDDHDRVQLALATGNVRGGAQAKLEHIELWSRFTCGGFGCDSGHRPDLVQVAIERACAVAGSRYEREDVIVVGDTPHDVSAARACGVKVLTVATGSYDRDALAACDPDAAFDTLAELAAWHSDAVAQRPA